MSYFFKNEVILCDFLQFDLVQILKFLFLLSLYKKRKYEIKNTKLGWKHIKRRRFISLFFQPVLGS